MGDWLRDTNEGLLSVLLLSCLVLSAEVGFRIARRGEAEGRAYLEAATIQGAVLGLLALLLGFTFSLAMARYEDRKDLIRDEANAIETTYLRAQFLDEAQRSGVVGLLPRYVETRFELQRSGASAARLREVHLRSSKLHAELWTHARAAAALHPESAMTEMFVTALNDTIDLHGKQMSSIRHFISAWIFLLLFVVALAATGLTGYASSPLRRQSFGLNLVVCLLITAVTVLIFDLQRPARGVITVDMGSLLDVRELVTGRL